MTAQTNSINFLVVIFFMLLPVPETRTLLELQATIHYKVLRVIFIYDKTGSYPRLWEAPFASHGGKDYR
jgi:hypothetical protein